MKRVLIVLLCSASILFAADWPQWRGENREDRSPDTGLLKTWPTNGPTLVWKATNLGSGYASVSVAKDRVYTTGDAGDSSFVHALDTDGKKIWSAKLGRSGAPPIGYPGTRGQPTVDGDLVFTMGQHGDLVCHQTADGKEVWRKNLVKDFNGKFGGWGYAESPLVDGDNLICTPGGLDGTMVALNKKTGEKVWRTTDLTDAAEYVSPVPATIAGMKQYVQMTGRSVFGVAPDGKLLWRADRKGRTATIPTPIVYKDHVYVTSGYGVGCNAFKVTKSGDAFKAEQVYENKVMVDHHGGVVRVGEYLYGHSDGKGWVCQKFDTGEMVWSNPGVGKGAVTYADGFLYTRSGGGKGTIALVEATPDGYKETGRFNQPDRSKENSWPHPVVINGRLYIRDQGVLLCYAVK